MIPRETLILSAFVHIYLYVIYSVMRIVFCAQSHKWYSQSLKHGQRNDIICVSQLGIVGHTSMKQRLMFCKSLGYDVLVTTELHNKQNNTNFSSKL